MAKRVIFLSDIIGTLPARPGGRMAPVQNSTRAQAESAKLRFRSR